MRKSRFTERHKKSCRSCASPWLFIRSSTSPTSILNGKRGPRSLSNQ